MAFSVGHYLLVGPKRRKLTAIVQVLTILVIISKAMLWPPELVTVEVAVLLSELVAAKIVRAFSFVCSVSHS